MGAAPISDVLILELVHDAVVVIDLQFRICVWNRAAESIYGWRAEDVMGQLATNVFRAVQYPHRTHTEDMRCALQHCGHWHGQIMQWHHDGHELIIAVSARRLDDASGVPIGVAYITQDITASAQLEVALRESEERLRALVQHSQDLISVIGLDGAIRYESPALERLLGYRPEERLGKSMLELIHPKDLATVLTAFAAVQSPGALLTVRCRMQHKDGTWRFIEAIGTNQLDNPAIHGIVVNTRDVTDREQANAVVQASEARFRAVFTCAPIGITLSDRTGRMLACNLAFQQLVGYSEDELRGALVLAYTHPDDWAVAQVLYQELVAGQRDRYQIEKRYLCKGGRVIWGRLTVSLVRDAAGAPHFAIGMVEDITEQKWAKDQLEHQAWHDVLTNLPNRALFLTRLDQALAHAKRRPEYQFAVLFLDLDHFKTVNDSLGHLIGDQVLIEVGRRIRTVLRPQDTLARLGGDEFVILLEDLADVTDATYVAQRIHTTLIAPFQVHGQEVVISTSVGIVLNTPGYQRPEELLRDADTALYRAKAKGRSQWTMFDVATHSRVMRLLQIEAELRRAIEREEFVLHYQPIVALTDGMVIGVEALVRWQHPEHGLLFPAQFISIAEDTGLIVPLGAWVVRTACAQTHCWHAAGVPSLTVAVNLSPRQLRASGVSSMLADSLAATGLSPQCLKLELTESSVIDQAEAVIGLLKDLHARGIQLALHNFGTGYLSLGYLQRLPITTIKLDRSFVRDSTTNSQDAAIATAIITLAHTLNVQVTAEGVETTDQVHFLRAQQVTAIQGYVCSQPLPAELLTPRLQAGTSFAPNVLKRRCPS